MYVPALPLLLEEFDTSASFLNLTMFMFMLVSACAILVAGPLTDKFGRKPILIVSCAVFAASSIGCALSTSVLMLTVFRVGQAIGFGLVETDVTAMIKDAYTDKDPKNTDRIAAAQLFAGLKVPFQPGGKPPALKDLVMKLRGAH